MTLTRRSVLKGLAGTIAAAAAPALILPPEPEKRFFPLDRTMLHRPKQVFHAIELEDRDTYFLKVIRPGDFLSVTEPDGTVRIARVQSVDTGYRNVYLDFGLGLNG